MKKSNANANDIALIAGVSNATVSRVFREPQLVSKKTSDKVLAAAKEIGYIPSRLGASLKQGRTFNIVVLVPDITNPYFSPIVRSIEKTAKSRGYSILLGDTLDSPEREQTYAKMVQSKQADGIIINSQRLPFELGSTSDQASKFPPLVSISELVDNEDVYRVGVDNIAIGKLATSHLIELGHKRIAVIAGTKNLQSCEDRLQGYKIALEEKGLKYNEKLIYYTNYSTETAAQATIKLMSDTPDISAIFSFGDLMSIGILHALSQLKFKVPEQISVISVDGISLAPYCNPPLTTIEQPMDKIGEKCINILIDVIEQKEPKDKLTILPHKLVCRESTGRYKGSK